MHVIFFSSLNMHHYSLQRPSVQRKHQKRSLAAGWLG